MSTAKEEMKTFVQNVLGCQCPPEVFTHMEYSGTKREDEKLLFSGKLNVGNTLLIYFTRVSDRGDLFRLVPALALRGKSDRDENEYNRFRLVLVCDDCDQMREIAEPIFSSLDFMDEKLHIHVVHPETIPWKI